MVERIVEWCARNRFLVFTGTVILTVWGVWAMRSIPVDAVPDISDVQVIVSTEWPGRSPDLIEDQITYPIVSALISTPRVRSVRSPADVSRKGRSRIRSIQNESPPAATSAS